MMQPGSGQQGQGTWGETLRGTWRGRARDLCVAALDLLLPPRCLSCGQEVDCVATLCPGCWRGLGFIAPPCCACCGLPFDFDPGSPDSLCGGCIAAPPAFGRCRSVFTYDAASRPLILGFKHGDRTDTAPALAQWMARAGAGLLADADLLVPVPLHRWRLFRRRFNQSALLAQALARLSGTAWLPDLLLRRRATAPQGGLTAKGRARNVAGAFRLHPRHASRAAGARILLIDDVFTTGATVSECARVLRRAGAAQVDVLTLARVEKPLRLDPPAEPKDGKGSIAPQRPLPAGPGPSY